ncbi:TPA: hypothetical protein SLH91_000629, partial [Enterobacter hormaechei]|nr:hypothetical protein [Enterobacter hormaechei]
MKSYSKYLMSVLLIILSFSVFAEKSSILTTEKNTDGSEWLIEKNGESYNLKYINAKGDIYSNDKIITSDIEGS